MSSSRRTAARCTVLAAALVFVVSACWSSTPTVSPAASEVPGPDPRRDRAGRRGHPDGRQPGPTATPIAPSATPAPSPSASPAPVIDPVAAAAALASLGSYRVSTAGRTAQGPFTAEMVVIQRPTPARSATITTGSSKIRIVTIGSKAWIDRTGKGKLAPGAFASSTARSALRAATLLSLFDGTAWLRVGPEVKNGVAAVHYHADATTGTGPGGATFPPGASIDLWVSPDGHLVAFEARGVPGRGRSVGPVDRGHAGPTTREQVTKPS